MIWKAFLLLYLVLNAYAVYAILTAPIREDMD